MSAELSIRFPCLKTLAALAVLTTSAAAIGVSAARAAPAASMRAAVADAEQPCAELASFDRHDFPELPQIDNVFFPLIPGTQRVLEGEVEGVPHRVTFTVTDLIKEIAGVNTIVVWDVDESEGEIVESELAFFAQDRDGNVWNLGEYPEEFEDGEFAGAPSTWIAREDGAVPGIHMSGSPSVGLPEYLQGFAPRIDFLDCATVVATGQSICVPFESSCFDNVLVTHERNPLDPEGGVQSKFHAPGVGIVAIGSVDPPTGETLELVQTAELEGEELQEVRQQARRLDRRAYRFAEEVYEDTEPVERLRLRDR
jgi:hypothetical protein